MLSAYEWTHAEDLCIELSCVQEIQSIPCLQKGNIRKSITSIR